MVIAVHIDGSGSLFGKFIFCLVFISLTSGFGYDCDNVDQTLKCATTTRCYSTLQKCNGVNDCGDNTDETNCTSIGVTKQLIITGSRSREENLAWLITPVILGMGVLYAIYKCFKDGLCHVRHMRRRREAHGSYFALDQISFYSMAPMPRTHIGSQGHHLMVVHNHSFAMAVSDLENLAQPTGEGDDQEALTPPPTYAESVNTGLNNAGFAPVPQEDPDLPPYKETATPPPPITPTASMSPLSQPSMMSPPISPRLPPPSSPSSTTTPPAVFTRITPLTSSPPCSSSSSSQPTLGSPTSSSQASPQSPRIPPPPSSPSHPVTVPSLQQLLLHINIRLHHHQQQQQQPRENSEQPVSGGKTYSTAGTNNKTS